MPPFGTTHACCARGSRVECEQSCGSFGPSWITFGFGCFSALRGCRSQFPFANGALTTPFRGEVAGEQISVDALNEPFEEFVICEHTFYSEWILFEIGHRFLSADRVVDKKPSLVVCEGTCQGQFTSALECPIILPMRRANGRESRFVG